MFPPVSSLELVRRESSQEPPAILRAIRRVTFKGFMGLGIPSAGSQIGDVESVRSTTCLFDPKPSTGATRWRRRWTLQLLADETVVLGLVDAISLETVRQALKRTTSSRRSPRPGASRARPTPSTSGGWRTSSRPTCGTTIRSIRSSASTRRASNSSARCDHPGGAARAERLKWTRSTSGRASITS